MLGRTLYLVRHGEAAGDEARLTAAGRQQAMLVGQRLAGVPFAGIWHSPLPRTAETAALIAAQLPGVPVTASELLGDYVPPAPAPEHLTELPARYAALLAEATQADLAAGIRLAGPALDRFAVSADGDRRELVVTHNQVIGWFVRHALDAPQWRWLGLNQCNGALTMIRYRPGYPPALLAFNELSHLPPELRWTGFPAELRA